MSHLAALALSLLFLLAYPLQASASWESFKYNSTRSSTTPFGVADLAPLQWTSIDIGGISAPPITSSSGAIYIPGTGSLTKLDKTGAKQWTISTPASGTVYTPVIDKNDIVYIASSGCNPIVYALNPDGSKKWQYDLREGSALCGANQTRAAVALSNDQSTLYVGTNYPNQKIYAFNLDGTVKWKSALMLNFEPDYSAITIDSSDNLYVGSSGGRIFSFKSDGTARWNQFIGGEVKTPIVGPDGNIYVVGNYGQKIVSYTSSGSIRWTYTPASPPIDVSPAVTSTIIYSAEKKTIRAINTSNGTVAWTWTSDNNANTTSPLVDKNGFIYTSAFDKVYSINIDGTTKSTLSLSETLGPLILSEDGKFIATRNPSSTTKGYTYAFGTAPKVSYPVVFIPGMGGSEFKVSQDIYFSGDDGHGGIYSHGYTANEKIWVNQNEAAKAGDDDYFDILKLKEDAVTPVSSGVTLTGELTPYGYGDIDSFFQGLGMSKKTGLPKVNIVAHSMGGLVARNYISATPSASKVNKLIEMGVPHLGTVLGLKAILYGEAISYNFYSLKIPIIASSEVKDISFNSAGMHTLIPSNFYFNLYNDSKQQKPQPFFDDRDIDKNNIIGNLNYLQQKDLIKNLKSNMTAYDIAEQYHTNLDSLLVQTNGVKLYEIVGSGPKTLGQIRETWWIEWPFKLIPRRDEIFITGDGTVPLYSASLKSDTLDYSGGAPIYYVNQKHEDLPSSNGTAMQTVKALLADDTLPTEVKSEKIVSDGKQISIEDAEIDLYDSSNNHTGLDANGNIEINIPDTIYDSIESSKHVYIGKSAGKVKVKIKPTHKASSTKKRTITLRHYTQDKISKTNLYVDLPLPDTTTTDFDLDPAIDTPPTIIAQGTSYSPPSEVVGDNSTDQIPPITTYTLNGSTNTINYSDSVIVNLTSTDDSGSGVLKTEYTLDNGQTVQTYNAPLTITTPGTYTLQFSSTDKVNNQETPISITFIIKSSTASTSTATTSSNNSSSSGTSTISTDIATSVINSFLDGSETQSRQEDVLGASTINWSPTPIVSKTPSSTPQTASSIFLGSFVVLGNILTSIFGLIASVGLNTTIETVEEIEEET